MINTNNDIYYDLKKVTENGLEVLSEMGFKIIAKKDGDSDES